MKQVVLDTSFIISAVKNKLDFFHYLEMEGFEVLIPEQVIRELRGLKSNLGLRIIESHKFKKIDLEHGNVDNGLVAFAKKNKMAIIATLDRELKKRISNPKLVIRGKKKLEVI